tara:strand:- start:4532 stop:4999 length:468 start_codon:yes stop_codon:yes gene_type:complete
MADDAIVSTTVTVLPDEIAKNFTGSMSVAPEDANDKWYYKLTTISTTSGNLIAGNFTDYTAVAAASAPSAITTSDKVKFLFIQNQSTTDGIVLCLDGGTAAHTLVDGIFIGPSQTFTVRCPNTTVGNLNAISADIDSVGDASVTAIVCALIDDVA